MRNIVLSILVLFSFTQCKKEQAQQQRPALPYPVVKVAEKNITDYASYPARLEGINNNMVRAKIAGYIEKVYVDEGQSVRKGQPLFKLETNAMSETADAAKAAVRVAQVEVDKLTPLVAKNIISKVQLETAKARLASTKSQLKQAQANIAYSVIRSPIDGIVGQIKFREGTLVSPASPALTNVANTKNIYAYFSMNESEYLAFLYKTEGKTRQEKLKNMPQVSLFLSNGQKYEHLGKIETTTGQVNPLSGTVQFRANFPNKEGILANGGSASVSLPIVHKNTLVVPEAATFEQQGVVLVYKLQADSVVPTKVDLIARVKNLALIKTGITLKDTIVASGVGKLRPGTKITPKTVELDSIVNKTPVKFK